MPNNTAVEKEIEDLREANHRLKLSIENMKQSHNNEIEDFRDELQIKEKELQSLNDKLKALSKKKETDVEDKLSSMSEAYNFARDEIIDLKAQVQQLQRAAEQYRTVQTDRHSFHEENEALKVATDRLNIELKNNRELLEKQQSKVYELTQDSIQMKGMISDIREQLESRDSYITELQSGMKELEKDKQDAMMELQHTLMMQQNAQQELQDPNRRGNSLFSEVEERRIRVEEELCRLRERVARLTTEKYELQSTIEKGDFRTGIILQQLQIMHRSEIDVVQDFKKLQSETLPLFNQYRDRLEALTTEYKRKLIQYRDGMTSPALGELESIRQERDLLFGEKMSLDQELWEIRKELKYTKQQLTEVDAKCKIFRTKLQALQEGIMSGSDKQKADTNGMGNNTMLDTTLNQTMCFDTSLVGNVNSNKQWFYNSILNDSKCIGPIDVNTPPNVTNTKVKSNVMDSSASRKSNTETKEIPECSQQ